LADALEPHDPADLGGMGTPAFVNLYTLLSDLQRNANELRRDVRSIFLDRRHHDRPVSGQYGSVQRTSRQNRSMRDEEEVLEMLESEGFDRERVTTVDTSKVDDAPDLTELSESNLFETVRIVCVSLRLLGSLALVGEPSDELLPVTLVCDAPTRFWVVLSRLMNENDSFNFSPHVRRNTPQDVRFRWFQAGSIEMCWSYVGSRFAVGKARKPHDVTGARRDFSVG
jgi:hypothetical protein